MIRKFKDLFFYQEGDLNELGYVSSLLREQNKRIRFCFFKLD